MPPDTQIISQLLQRVAYLESQMREFKRADRFYFSRDIETPTDIGIKLATAATQKLGFWGQTPVTQFGAPTGRADTSSSSGTTMTTGHRFNGNTGSDYYSVGDIVYALKQCGILENA